MENTTPEWAESWSTPHQKPGRAKSCTRSLTILKHVSAGNCSRKSEQTCPRLDGGIDIQQPLTTIRIWAFLCDSVFLF